MTLDRKLVQVTNPQPENSLAKGVTGMARSIRSRGTGSITSELYSLAPEDGADLAKVAGLLFTEAELEELL